MDIKNITTEIVDKDSISQEILDFCKQASLKTDDPAHKNMYHDNWQDHPEVLPYVLYIHKRFKGDNGDFFVLRVDGIIEAIAGVYISSFDSNVAIGGVRAWVNPQYRAKMLVGHHLLPLHLEWAKEKRCKTIALTFNEYNKRLVNYFKRSGLGVPKERNANRMFYNGVHEVPFTCEIQFTEQWVIYDKIDPDYEPDWESIRWHV